MVFLLTSEGRVLRYSLSPNTWLKWHHCYQKCATLKPKPSGKENDKCSTSATTGVTTGVTLYSVTHRIRWPEAVQCSFDWNGHTEKSSIFFGWYLVNDTVELIWSPVCSFYFGFCSYCSPPLKSKNFSPVVIGKKKWDRVNECPTPLQLSKFSLDLV